MLGALVTPVGPRAGDAEKPACLPEQLLCSALERRPSRASARAASALSGQCAPQASALGVETALPSIARGRRDMRGLAGVRGAGQRQLVVGQREFSAAPLSISGSACIGFTAERGKTGCSTIAEAKHQRAIRINDQRPRRGARTRRNRRG